jgi:uncharacterized membrane protein YdcZ (DUF606 family)
MDFPIEFLAEYSLWMNWVSTVGVIVILIVTVLVATFADADSADSNLQFALMAGVVGLVVAFLFGFIWPILVIAGVLALLIVGLRLLADWLRDSYFYYRYEK